jgi:hypothetical protein
VIPEEDLRDFAAVDRCLKRCKTTVSIWNLFSTAAVRLLILDYDSKAKKATLKQGLSKELQASLIYQTNEPEDFDKFVELCLNLDY